METNGTAMRHVSANTEAEQLLITLLQSELPTRATDVQLRKHTDVRVNSGMDRLEFLPFIFQGLALLLLSFFSFWWVTREATPPAWWNWMQGPTSVWLERIGILLQLIAGLSVIPELIGEVTMRTMEGNLRKMYESLGHVRPFRGLIRRSEYNPTKMGCLLELGMALLWLGSVAALWWLGSRSVPDYRSLQLITFSLVLLTGYVATVMAEAIAFFATIFLTACIRLFPFRRLLTVVTFPLFIIGTSLQFISTFF